MVSRVAEEMHAALAAAADADASPLDRAEMLMETAMALQQRPKSPDQLNSAVELYDACGTTLAVADSGNNRVLPWDTAP